MYPILILKQQVDSDNGISYEALLFDYKTSYPLT